MALTGPRMTDSVEGVDRVFPVAAGVKIWQGALVALVAGLAQPGSIVAGGLGLGRAEQTVDNTGGIAGALAVKVRRGVFKFANAAADPVGANQVGRNCYILDDATVAATDGGNGARSVAGLVHQVDADGVWVRF